MKTIIRLRALLFAVPLLLASPALASQATIVGPITGPHTEADVMGTINGAFLAIQSCNSGSSAPANGPSSAPVSFQWWCDNTANPAIVKMFDGTSWVVVGKVNTSTHVFTPSYQGTDTGTASTATTGTSGHTLGFLDAANTYSGIQSGATAAVDTNTTQFATTAFVLGQAASATPLIDGTATVGTSTRYARGDHVHPTDTTRAPLASPTLTGTPAAPTAAANTNTTQIATTAFVLGQVGTANPIIDGTAAPGTSLLYARQDHVHPTDTTRAIATRNISTGCGLTGGGDLTADRTLKFNLLINPQTGTSYPVVDGDCGKLITLKNASAVAVSLPQANGSTFVNGWSVDFQNKGAGTVTVTPVASTINDGASIALTTNQGMHCRSDGTNYACMEGVGAGGGSGTVTNVATAGLASGGPITATGTITVTAAAKTDQQTATSNVLAVTPLHQQDHDSAGKAWIDFTGSTGASLTAYNATVSRSSQGIFVVTFTTAFASANYMCQITPESAGSASTNAMYGIVVTSTPKTASAATIQFFNSAGTVSEDPTVGHILCFGRQ